MKERDWEREFWDVILYEPAHDARMQHSAKRTIQGIDVDYTILRGVIQRRYNLSSTEFDRAFSIAEREAEMELFNGET